MGGAAAAGPKTPPATGNVASPANSPLLPIMSCSFPRWPRSGSRVGVAGGRHVEPQHHRVVLVDDVVTVHGVAAQPIAEPHPDRGVAPRDQAHRVLARKVHAGRGPAVATGPAVLAAPAAVVRAVVGAAAVEARSPLRHLVLLQVDVDGVRPAPAVLEVPLLQAVLLDQEARRVARKKVAVDGPLSVAALVEVEVPGYPRRG